MPILKCENGHTIQEGENIDFVMAPCSTCGSKNLNFEAELKVGVGISEMRAKSIEKRESKKPYIEASSKPDIFCKTG